MAKFGLFFLFLLPGCIPLVFFDGFVFGLFFQSKTVIVAFHTTDSTFACFNWWSYDGVARDINGPNIHVTNPHWDFFKKVVHHFENSECFELVQIFGQISQVVVTKVEGFKFGQEFWVSGNDNF